MMNEQAFKKLEFDILRLLFKRHGQTEIGRARLDRLVPIEDRNELKRQLQALEDNVSLKDRNISWSFSDFEDPKECFSKLKIKGSVLETLILLGLADLCDQALEVRNIIWAERELCPTLWSIVENLSPSLKKTVLDIRKKILPGGEVDDHASSVLLRLRQEIRRRRQNIIQTLEGLMRDSNAAVREKLVTIRNGRFVIPVKYNHSKRMQGVVHAYSSSGATVFMEPLEIIEEANNLQELREKEAQEIARILLELTDKLRDQLQELKVAAEAVAELDIINAKAKFLRKFRAVVPIIDSDQILELSEARHPLLEENLSSSDKNVVPISLKLDMNFPVMIVSGTNAGGKTVVLKTAGLLVLMALSGLPVPAISARIPFYASVLADIDSQQSIATGLSTFTSNITNVSRMMDLCQHPALILLDEIGTGTDPEEGSALSVAVVDHFCRACRAHVLASTHYQGLKIYAANEKKVQNASVEYDEVTLQPTYRLTIGLAGVSSGFEIARRFGVPDSIIEEASIRMNKTSIQVTEYLQNIKHELNKVKEIRVDLEKERQSIKKKRAAIDLEDLDLKRRYAKKFKQNSRKARRDFEQQTQKILSRIEDQAMRMTLERDIKAQQQRLKRQSEGQVERIVFDQAKPSEKDGLIVRTRELKGKGSFRVITSRPINCGDQVLLKGLGSLAIVESINNENVELRLGSMRLREKLSNLELVESLSPREKQGARAKKRLDQENNEVKTIVENREIGAELKLIGKRTEDAVDELDQYLDKAFLKGLVHLRIIHGFGAGALRRAVQKHLENHPHVLQFKSAQNEQGGEGVTLVDLKA